MIESRLLELIEYRMGKTHNNVALAREILAEVSRPESGSVGSVKALDALRVEMMEGQGDASSSTVIDWANRIREAVSLLSTAQPAPSAGSVPSVEELAAMGVIISERKRKERPGLLVIGADYWLEFAKELNSLLLSTAHRGEVSREPDKRDVILPWVELQDLLMYFHTIGDEKAETMLRGLSPAPGVAEAVEALQAVAAIYDSKTGKLNEFLDTIQGAEPLVRRALASLGVKP